MNYLSKDYIYEKWNHAGFQKYFRNTGWMLGGRAFSLAISFFVGIYVARYLGPANYGLLNYVISFVGLFGFLASFGIDTVINREIIRDHSKRDVLIGTAFYIKLFGSILAIISVFIISILTTEDIFTLALIWLFSLNFIPQAFNIIETYFQSQVLSKKAVTSQIISSVVSSLLKILIIILGKGIFWLLVVYIIETCIYALILLISYRNFGNHIRQWKFKLSIAKNILRDSWPLMISSVAFGIYMKIDQVMIKNMIGNESVGLYAVAVKLSEVWYFIPSLICISVFPAIMNALKTDTQEFNKRIGRLYFAMFWMAIIISLIITLFSEFIIDFFFGDAYLLAVPVLQIYVWSNVGAFTNMAISNHLNSKNLNIIFLYSTIIGAVSNVLLNIIFISKYGIAGAALATLISYNLATLSIFMFKRSDVKLSTWLRSILIYK